MIKYKKITPDVAKKDMERKFVFIREVTTEDGEDNNVLSILLEIGGYHYIVRCPTNSVADGVFKGTVQ